MEILNLSVPAANRFASKYIEQSDVIMPFFHYRTNDINEDFKRLDELKTRTFLRKEVADYIQKFMDGLPSSMAVRKSLDKLKTENSVVVIGGQQAGILTGPLYSIHKVISIIKLAEQKERQLGVPVVPVFWIAGEDHDFQEVNHVFVPVEEKVDKWTYPERVLQKKMVSDIPLNKEVCLEWVENLIGNFGETSHTNQLIDFAKKLIHQSTTFVEFFAHIIMELFKDYGLLLVDSGDKSFRQLQKQFLAEQIKDHEQITSSLLDQQKQIEEKGFVLTIEANERAANLFYYDHTKGDRILLEYDHESSRFVGKSGKISLTKEQLLELAEEKPEFLSNNVVTRPLMQEWLFPTLAFIAGPGEIAYWAELKLVFEHFCIKLPPIVPRLNITFLDRAIETDIKELNLDLSTVLQSGAQMGKEEFLDTIKDKDLEGIFTDIKDQLVNQYQRIEAKTLEIDKGLLGLVDKNQKYLLKEISFMQTKLEDSVKHRHNIILNKYTRVDLALRPDGSPQERMWNLFYYLNQYGLNFIEELMMQPFEFDGYHKVVKI
ncbi:bacillithiol biosynthesis cysteine-adding enzyme BshC [Neobacillus dielmonensis]|uniref:bacillithiol biosynthesis cysteine-adding enzyme BshC n=1 Tax=Neobacillus dielmonensis TaxID=1347369 RepID=UPI0005A9B630|nr:bacillithiol biosynthesis cysteine-adding enzyme BshC [Neobacillus dielmonensis]